MSKTVIDQVVERFNAMDMDGLAELLHDDIKVYDFKTNKMLIDSKQDLLDNDRPFVLDESMKLRKDRVLIKGCLEICYITIKKTHDERIQIFEIEDGLLKTIWITLFKRRE